MPDVLQAWATMFPVRQKTGTAMGEPMAGRVSLPAPFAPAVAVNRRVLRVAHVANYHYKSPARRVHTRLRLIPPPQRGFQRRRSFDIHVAPLPFDRPHFSDPFGNDVLEIRHDTVLENLTLVVESTVETYCAYTQEGRPLPIGFPAPEADRSDPRYLEFTNRTSPDDSLRAMAREIGEVSDWVNSPQVSLAALGARIHKEMTFQSGSTDVGTAAAEAWANRRGVCQDYSHICVTLLRLCGVPARYVSGFVPGEGVMHAWIEALLPIPGQPANQRYWFPFDTTYNQWVNENYFTVASGRDYGDITPTSGTYYGGANHLTYHNRLEKASKEVLLVPS